LDDELRIDLKPQHRSPILRRGIGLQENCLGRKGGGDGFKKLRAA
jgi:hypothetical protein